LHLVVHFYPDRIHLINLCRAPRAPDSYSFFFSAWKTGTRENITVNSCFETPSIPTLRCCYPCSFTFYVAQPLGSVPTFLRDTLRR
jgi:hypothetical protein